MRKLIILLCMVLVVALVNAGPLDIRDPSIGNMTTKDAYPGMVFTDGRFTYYVNDARSDCVMLTNVSRVDGRVCLFQVIITDWDINRFYQVYGTIALFGGLRAGSPIGVMYKEAEDTELYVGEMYMPIDVVIDTSSDYQRVTYTHVLEPSIDESWNTIMVWNMDGTMLYSGIIGEL